tara:strand:- start:7131 stop:7523 length:393 start_codon:yes stop_codon:yes gene_type:complete
MRPRPSTPSLNRKTTVVIAVMAMATALVGCSGPSEEVIDTVVRQGFDHNPALAMMMGLSGANFKPSSMVEKVHRHGCNRVLGGYVCVIGVQFAEPFASSMGWMLGPEGTYNTRYQFVMTDEGWYAEELVE